VDEFTSLVKDNLNLSIISEYSTGYIWLRRAAVVLSRLLAPGYLRCFWHHCCRFGIFWL